MPDLAYQGVYAINAAQARKRFIDTYQQTGCTWETVRRRGINIAAMAVARRLVMLFRRLVQQPVTCAHLRAATLRHQAVDLGLSHQG